MDKTHSPIRIGQFEYTNEDNRAVFRQTCTAYFLMLGVSIVFFVAFGGIFIQLSFAIVPHVPAI